MKLTCFEIKNCAEMLNPLHANNKAAKLLGRVAVAGIAAAFSIAFSRRPKYLLRTNMTDQNVSVCNLIQRLKSK